MHFGKKLSDIILNHLLASLQLRGRQKILKKKSELQLFNSVNLTLLHSPNKPLCTDNVLSNSEGLKQVNI